MNANSNHRQIPHMVQDNHPITEYKFRIILALFIASLGVQDLNAEWSSPGNGLEQFPASAWGISAADSLTFWATTWVDVNFDAFYCCVEFLSPTVGFAGGHIYELRARGHYKWHNDDVLSVLPTEKSKGFSIFSNSAQDHLPLKVDGVKQISIVKMLDFYGSTIADDSQSHDEKWVEIAVSDLRSCSYLIQIALREKISEQTFYSTMSDPNKTRLNEYLDNRMHDSKLHILN